VSTLSPQSVAKALGGDVVNGNKVLAPGPGHSAKDRSLSIEVDGDAPDGFTVHSFAGDDWKVCKDHVRETLGLDTQKSAKAPVAREARRIVAEASVSALFYSKARKNTFDRQADVFRASRLPQRIDHNGVKPWPLMIARKPTSNA